MKPQDPLLPKAGIYTTEFWRTLIFSVFGLLAGLHVIPNGLPDRYSSYVQVAALALTAVAGGAYAISRGLAKHQHGNSLSELLQTSMSILNSGGGDEARAAALTLLQRYVPGLERQLSLPEPVADSVNRTLGDFADRLGRVETQAAAASKLATAASPVTVAVGDTASSSSVGNFATGGVVSGQGPSAPDVYQATEPADGVPESGPGGWPEDTNRLGLAVPIN